MSVKRGKQPHVADKAHQKKWDELDAKIPTMSGHMSEFMALKCKKCGSGPRHLISFYAFTRGDNWRLIGCNCPGKHVWYQLTGVKDATMD